MGGSAAHFFRPKLRSLASFSFSSSSSSSMRVFCSEKSPIVPQLYCSVILIVKHQDLEDHDEHENE
jgi:hypothetical protein